MRRVEPFARGLAWVALVLGLTHAGFSAYWALGGRCLLRTVGEWAVTLAASDPGRAGLISWVGAVGLVLYGGANVVVSGAVLAGLIQVDGGDDRAAMIGHVALWDPLFALGGCALLGSLWMSRRRR